MIRLVVLGFCLGMGMGFGQSLFYRLYDKLEEWWLERKR